jgi:GT2 family glycosyltransferase
MIVARDADPGLRICSDAWAECLREGGLDVSSADVCNASPEATALVVAPYAALGPLANDPHRLAGVLRRAVCISTSRLGSGALGADLPFHRAASASVALSRDAARYFSARGVPTAHLRPGGHARLRASRAEPRCIAVGTHARYSSFREDLLARSRDVLDPYPCDLRISHSAADRPASHLAPDDWLPWLTSLDVLVSLSIDAGPGTEWSEVAPAVMNGAIVLTTAESDFGPLEPGEDVAIATGTGFADALRRLLADDERRDRMRASALARLSASPLDATPLAEALLSVESSRRRSRPLMPSGEGRRGEPATSESDSASALSAAKAARSRRAQLRTDGADRMTTTSAWDSASPAVSVVIPSYGQAEFISSAVESALAAVGVELEIVVIDDRSPDASAGIVRDLMTVHDEQALKLVELADNAGLSEARNRGFLESRAPLILLLDADDALLPHGPAALLAALEANPDAAFAYGMLARFGLECEDLLGTSPWDPKLFRHGNYVPVTCSLIRRSAWELVGGYSAEGLLELGWEDMDFWLRLADAGEHAVQVRRIVGAYRVHGVSMSTLTNTHAGALMTFLRQRYPRLMGSDDS